MSGAGAPEPPTQSRGPTDPNDERREFAARYASLEGTAAFAQSFCDRHGLAHDSVLKLALIMEELLTNTIEHGFGGERDDAVGITLRASGPEVVLLYEDGAPPFDPLTPASRTPALEDALDARAVGGFGLRLVNGLLSGARYAREEGRNRLWITLRADSLPQ